MCMEDIRIGEKRYARVTPCPAGTTTNLKGDSKRVAVKLMSLTAAGSTASAFAFGTGTSSLSSFMMTNASRPVDQITLEEHGNLVKIEFGVTVTTSPAVIIETLLDDHQCAPPAQQCQPSSLPGQQ